jgi:hypothetical protein
MRGEAGERDRFELANSLSMKANEFEREADELAPFSPPAVVIDGCSRGGLVTINRQSCHEKSAITGRRVAGEKPADELVHYGSDET